MSKIIKRSFVAYTWDEYASQGEGYQAVRQWWEQNAASLPGSYDSSYRSWTEWYKEKYYGEWGSSHRGPDTALDLLKSEVAGGGSQPRETRRRRVQDMIGGLFDRQDSENGTGRLRGGSDGYRRLIGANPGANVDKTSDNVKEFLAALGNLAKQKGYEKPFVTSAFRSSRAQVRAMAGNWRRKGGPEIVSDAEAVNLLKFHRGADYIAKIRQYTNKPLNKGLVYFFDLYGDKEMVIGLNEIFMEMGAQRAGIKAGTEYWDSLGRPQRSHLANPATSVDLRLTRGIKELLDEIEQSGQFTLKILDEGDHFHVNVRA